MTDTISEQSRYRGCLLGGAVGDALGAPVEFHSRDAIIQRFGNGGIRDYVPAYGGSGRITDDTQMTLFTAEGLIRGWVRGIAPEVSAYSRVMAGAYERWLSTQGAGLWRVTATWPGQSGWLSSHPQLHERRAPGNTCLSALQAMTVLGEPANNFSKGCGGVMRVAPVGLFVNGSGSAFDYGVEFAGLTHGHPTGKLASGVLAVIIQGLRQGESLETTLSQADQILSACERNEETRSIVTRARELANSTMAPASAIRELGQGWIAEEALAIGVYAALRAETFEEAVIMAVNHDGDSDSTGSIAGQIRGAQDGVEAIPNRWLEPLELREVITQISDDLQDCARWSREHDREEAKDRVWDELVSRYPAL